MCSPNQAVLTNCRVNPARAKACMGHCISGWPRTRSNGLGVLSVKGRMRSPRPAAKIMAVAGEGGGAMRAPGV